MSRFTFRREERLKSQKVIEQLFKGGNSFARYPLRVVWTVMDSAQSDFPAQFALSVSKKKFKKAVTRNRIRRLVREAYRLNKHWLYEALSRTPKADSAEAAPRQVALMIIYTSTEVLPFAEVNQAMRDLLRRLAKNIRQATHEA